MDPQNCPPLDVVCHGKNTMGQMFEQGAVALRTLGWGFLEGAFGKNAGTLSASEWNVATAMASKWGLVLLIVVILIGAIRILQALLQGDTRVAVSAALWAVFSWPITMLAIWGAIVVTDATDRLSNGILSDGSGEMSDAIGKLFVIPSGILDIAGAGDNVQLEYVGFMMISFVLMGAALIAAFILSLMLAFRNFALIVLVGFAPIAFMALPMDSLRGWIRSWAQATIALIVAKPLAAGILVMTHSVLGGADSLWGWIVGLVGMAMAAFAPIITMGLFQWAGGQTASSYGAHSSSVVANTGAGITRVGRGAASVIQR